MSRGLSRQQLTILQRLRLAEESGEQRLDAAALIDVFFSERDRTQVTLSSYRRKDLITRVKRALKSLRKRDIVHITYQPVRYGEYAPKQLHADLNVPRLTQLFREKSG